MSWRRLYGLFVYIKKVFQHWHLLCRGLIADVHYLYLLNFFDGSRHVGSLGSSRIGSLGSGRIGCLGSWRWLGSVRNFRDRFLFRNFGGGKFGRIGESDRFFRFDQFDRFGLFRNFGFFDGQFRFRESFFGFFFVFEPSGLVSML
jgi:hypothetical protein